MRGGQWRIVAQAFDAHRLEQAQCRAPGMTAADDAATQARRLAPDPFRVGEHRGEHVLADRARIAARRRGEGDAACAEQALVDVVGAGRRGADETHRRAVEQRGVDARDRADEEHVGAGQQFGGDLAAVDERDLAQRREGRGGLRDDAIGNDAQWQHGAGGAQGRSSSAAPSFWIGSSSSRVAPSASTIAPAM